jgi:hypothetical protein
MNGELEGSEFRAAISQMRLAAYAPQTRPHLVYMEQRTTGCRTCALALGPAPMRMRVHFTHRVPVPPNAAVSAPMCLFGGRSQDHKNTKLRSRGCLRDRSSTRIHTCTNPHTYILIYIRCQVFAAFRKREDHQTYQIAVHVSSDQNCRMIEL